MPEASAQSVVASEPAVLIERALGDAIAQALGDEFADADAQVRPSQSPQFGDYQSNVAMPLAKRIGEKPRDLAQRIVDIAQRSESFASLVEEVAVPVRASSIFACARMRSPTCS